MNKANIKNRAEKSASSIIFIVAFYGNKDVNRVKKSKKKGGNCHEKRS